MTSQRTRTKRIRLVSELGLRFCAVVSALTLLSPLHSIFHQVEGLAVTPTSKNKAGSGSGNNKGASSTGFGGSQSRTPWKTHTTDETETTIQLLDFLNSQKSKGLANIEVGYVADRRGIFSMKQFGTDDVVCQIPSDSVLALSDPSQGGEDAPTMAHNGLKFALLYWKNQDGRNGNTDPSLWIPYLNTLPQAIGLTVDGRNMTPDLYDSDDEVSLLEFPRLIANVKQRKSELETVFASPECTAAGLSIQDLRYAAWIVSTRAFAIAMQSQSMDEVPQYDDRGQVITTTEADRKYIRVLIPLYDMIQHDSAEPNARIVIIDPEKDDAWFAIQATRPISPGKEIKIAYNGGLGVGVSYTSDDLLLNYGIAQTQRVNPVDSLMIKKGSGDILRTVGDWSTTLDEDQKMLDMIVEGDKSKEILRKILSFRIQMKKAYLL
jgi:SET domain